jgi:hypothetical protein
MEVTQEFIDLIENITFLEVYDKANLVLILFGLKPACEVDIFHPEDGSMLQNVLSPLGIHCFQSQHYKQSSWDDIVNNIDFQIEVPVAMYAVASDPETARRLSYLNSGRDHREYGQMMGYPETAIDNFLNQAPCLDKDQFEKLAKEFGIIFNMRLSATNYIKEIEVLKKWSEAVKVNSPAIYAEALEYYNRKI